MSSLAGTFGLIILIGGSILVTALYVYLRIYRPRERLLAKGYEVCDRCGGVFEPGTETCPKCDVPLKGKL